MSRKKCFCHTKLGTCLVSFSWDQAQPNSSNFYSNNPVTPTTASTIHTCILQALELTVYPKQAQAPCNQQGSCLLPSTPGTVNINKILTKY